MSRKARLLNIFSLLAVLAIALVAVSPAYAMEDQQDNCEDEGGTWNGADAFNGSCGYGLGNTSAEKECGEHGMLTETFSAGVQTGSNCEYESTSIGTAGDETKGSKAVTLSLGQGKNGSATFSPAACPKKCTITANLFRSAKNALPTGSLATLSVRIVGGEGGGYLVCFKTGGLTNPSIYKFIGSTWVRIATISSGNRICASTSGTASYYLGAD